MQRSVTSMVEGVVFLSQPVDRGWPRGYSLPSEAQVVLFQPQVASWDNQKHMVALAAVSVFTHPGFAGARVITVPTTTEVWR